MDLKRVPTPVSDSARLPNALIAGVSLCLTVYWLSVVLLRRPIGDYGVETDFYGDIVYYARAWMSGHPSLMNGYRGPVYYLVIGSLERLFGDAFLVGKTLSALSGGLSVWLTGRLLSRIWSPVVGLFGSLFLAANLPFVHHAVRACTDLPYFALYLGVLTLLFGSPSAGAGRLSWREWSVAGCLAALATMIRYNGLVLVPIAVAVALLSEGALRRRIVAFGGFLGLFLFTLAPWSLFLWSRTGNPLWNNNFKNVAIDVFTSHAGVAQTGRFLGAIDFTSIGEVYRTAPGRFLGRMGTNLWVHLRADVIELVGYPWAIVALLGLIAAAIGWAGRRGPLRRPVLAFVATAVLSFLALVPVFYNARFMLSLLPFWAAGVGLLGDATVRALPALGGARLSSVRLRAWALVAVAALLLVPSVEMQKGEYERLWDPLDSEAAPMEILDLAQKAKRSGFVFGPTTPVAARKPHLGYYLDIPVIDLVPGSLQQVGAHYLLVSGLEARWSGSLASLMFPRRPEEVPEGLEIVAQSYLPMVEGGGRSATLYAVLDPEPWSPPPLMQRAPAGTVIAGLDRLDTLRLRIVRWIHFWDWHSDSRDLIDRIGAQDHPQVLLVRGDRALMDHDASGARALYGQALPGLENPEEGILRLIAIGMLTNDDALVEEQVAKLPVPNRGPRERGAADWLEMAGRYRNASDYIATLAPSAFALSQSPDDLGTARTFGLTLLQLGWPEIGRPILERCLEAFPDDEGLREVLRTPVRQDP